MLIHRWMNMLLNSLTGFQCILSNLRDCRRSFPIGQQHLLHTDMVRRWLRQNISQMFLDITLDFDYASPNGKNIIMRISYFDALS